MEIIDIIIIILLIFGFYKGFKNGLLVELASLVSLFIGIYFAIKLTDIIVIAVQQITNFSPFVLKIIVFILILIVVILLVFLLAKTLTGILKFAFLGWANTFLGGFLSLIKVALIIGVVLQLFLKINEHILILNKEKQEKSIFFNPIVKTSDFLFPYLKDWFYSIKETVSKEIKE